MKFKNVLLALAVIAVVPVNAQAAPVCVAEFEQCLNDSWDTSGFTRKLADLECAARYTGCIRRAIF